MSNTTTLITKQRVKDWQACEDGYRWFLANYKPAEAEFVPVYQHLVRDDRGGDADWLMGKLFAEIDGALSVKLVTQIAGAEEKLIAEQVAAGATGFSTEDEANAATTGEGANAATTGNRANAATTGNRANAATTGNWANAATTGNRANAATTGNWANAATTGYRANAATTGEGANAATTGEGANAATTGEGANAATTGNRANAATTGNWANAATTGEGAVSAVLGRYGKAMAGEGGAIVIAYRDDSGELLGVKTAMVGQDGIKPGIWYSLDKSGNFIESTED